MQGESKIKSKGNPWIVKGKCIQSEGEPLDFDRQCARRAKWGPMVFERKQRENHWGHPYIFKEKMEIIIRDHPWFLKGNTLENHRGEACIPKGK